MRRSYFTYDTEHRNDGAGPLSRKPSGAETLRAICFVAALAKAIAFAAVYASHLIAQSHRRDPESHCNSLQKREVFLVMSGR